MCILPVVDTPVFGTELVLAIGPFGTWFQKSFNVLLLLIIGLI